MPTTHPVPDATLPALFEARVRSAPDAAAIRGSTGELSAAELNSRANRLARLLIGLGAGPERIVAVAVPRSAEMITAFLAVLKTGAAYLPIDPSYPRDRNAFMLADAAPAVLVTTGEAGIGLTAKQRVLLGDPTEVDLSDSDPTDAERLAPLTSQHPAYVIYTSGSTGTPKGVVMPGSCMVNLLAWHAENLPFEPRTNTGQLSAIGFDVSMHEILSTLVHGRCLVIPTEAIRRDPVALVQWLDEQRIQQLFLPNVLIESICDAASTLGLPLRRLTDIVQSGEALTLRGSVRAFLSAQPGRRIHNHYGSAEMQDVTTWVADGSNSVSPAPMGRPLWNTAAYVLDGDLAAADTGELYIAGAGLARGYLNRPALTAERFVPDPFGSPGSRMYRTGDVARLNRDGDLEFLGRADTQVKVHGFRVETGEVEAALVARPDIVTAVVTAKPGPLGQPHLVAYVVPVAGAHPDSAEVQSALAVRLPSHMVPGAIVPVDRLPLTPSGKVDVKALPAPDRVSTSAAAETANEHVLAKVFGEVLGRTDVGIDDNFVRLGGDSVGVLQLVILAKQGGLAITTREVFELGTVRRLAAVASPADSTNGTYPGQRPLISLTGEQLSRLQAACPAIEDILPVTPLQQGLVFHSLSTGHEVDPYVEVVTLRLTGALDRACLRASAQTLVDRHPQLRASIHLHGLARPVQVISSTLDVAWDEGATDDCRQRFTLSEPPLVRFRLIEPAPDRHHLVITHHHAVLDGWSVSLLLKELMAVYRGDLATLPPAPPYRDHLHWLQSRDEQAAETAWRAVLAEVPRPTIVAPGSTTHRRGRLETSLTEGGTRRLNDVSRAHGLTVNTVVQGLWGLLLRRETDAEQVLFGTTVSGRAPEVPAVRDMVGVLVNTIPVRVSASESDRVLSVLSRVQREQAALVPHNHIGLAVLRRTTGWPELFDTLVVFENPALQPFREPQEVDGLRVEGIDVSEDSHYAISLVATPGLELRLHATYDSGLLAPDRVRSLVIGLQELLKNWSSRPEQSVAELTRRQASCSTTASNRPRRRGA